MLLALRVFTATPSFGESTKTLSPKDENAIVNNINRI